MGNSRCDCCGFSNNKGIGVFFVHADRSAENNKKICILDLPGIEIFDPDLDVSNAAPALTEDRIENADILETDVAKGETTFHQNTMSFLHIRRNGNIKYNARSTIQTREFSASLLLLTTARRRFIKAARVARALQLCLPGSGMFALGHKRTFAVKNGMSALPPKADIRSAKADVRR